MKTCLISPRLLKVKKDKTNKSSQILEDLSKFETSEYLKPATTRHNKSKKKRKLNKSNNIFSDSSQLFKTLSPYTKKNLTSRQPKPENLSKDQPKKFFLREKLKKTQEKIRKKQAKKILGVKHPLPWGADQRIFKRKKTSDNDEGKSKLKTDRDTSRRALRKEIGLDLYPNIRVKTRLLNKSEERHKLKRSPDPVVQSYIKKKKKNERLVKIRLKLEENLKEKERIKALANLEKSPNKRGKKKRRRRIRSILFNDEEKSTDPTASIINRRGKGEEQELTPNTEPNKYHSKENSAGFGLPLKEIVTIQRWFRKIQRKMKKPKRNSEVLLEHPSNKEITGQILSSLQKNSPEFKATEQNTSEEYSIKIPKKVEKVPILCLTSILQSRNSSFDESNRKKQFAGCYPRESEDFEELYERFQNFNIDSLESFSSGVKDINRPDGPSFQSENSFLAIKKNEEISSELSGKNKENSLSRIEKNKETPLNSLIKNKDINLSSLARNKEENLDGFEKNEENPNSSESSEENSSQSSDYSDAENSLKRILQNQEKKKSVAELYERPGIVMIDPSDSSEEEWNSNNILIHTDTNISEQTLETLEYKQRYFLTDYDPELQNLINEEIDSFIQSVNFLIREKEVDTSQKFINKIVNNVFEELEKNEEIFLREMNLPLFFDPKAKLKILQTSSVGELHKSVCLKKIIPDGIKYKVQEGCSKTESQKSYVQMICAAMDEAMNSALPFGFSGFPDPWSATPPIFNRESQIFYIFQKILKTLASWESVKNGILNVNQDEAGKIREERLNLILTQCIRDSEESWLDYEDEESQLKFDISDLILAQLITETWALLQTSTLYTIPNINNS